MRILLTGFEPFDGRSVNSSERVVAALAREPLDGIALHTAILPVDAARAPELLLARVGACQPGAVICLGQAARRTAISIERLFVNLLDFERPDNAAQQIRETPVVADGPAAYFSTLPVVVLAAAIRAAGVPVELSRDAGTYLCNQVAYRLLHALAREAGGGSTRVWSVMGGTGVSPVIRAGFIHLPLLTEQVAEAGDKLPSMELTTLVRGVRAGLLALSAACSAPQG